MIVGVDISSIVYGRGVSRYTANLIAALLEENVVLQLYGSSLRQHGELLQFVKHLEKNYSKNIVHKLEYLPPKLLSFLWHTLERHTVQNQLPGIELFHSWDWLQPPDTNIPLVSTIHDLAILKYPESAHPVITIQHKRAWEILKKKQARIIAVSAATKKDIVQLLGYPGYLVDVVHEALPREVREVSISLSEEMYDAIKANLQLTKPYLLFVGTREPRKNLTTLIDAWKPLSSELELIIAGSQGWDDSEKQVIPGLRFLGRVSDQELSVLYAEAEAFVYPSLYEGFGLPILEAFHHGTPVITSNTSAMLEVAGNAAEFVEPLDSQALTTAITKVLSESKEQQQKRLQRMIIRLQMFSWKRVAKETLAVYQKAINDHAH